ncbi:hypothetical protein QBC32DRAFT_369082 [Pseudoneurospora amorphoporcata]|uniref:Uncharacterized protein n=1 Tax=Pseudoneurospora amorphoporcata TaxID=241081 RepID=A0AAN6SHI4_9PEZI|nr:hypothetical protein QBC32DRAFT_369082 [Pseudoneurospora amorphoporcata]
MCGHTEHRETRCSPPIIHWNGKPELCKKKLIYLQSTKNGICTQCRTKRLEASMARSNRVNKDKQHGHKILRPGLNDAPKNEKPSNCTDIQVASSEELYRRKQNEEGVAENTSAKPMLHIGLDHFRCRLGLSHTGPCIRAKDQTDQSPRHNKETSAEPTASGGGRALLQLRSSANPALRKCDKRRPGLSLPSDKIRTIAGAEGEHDKQKVTLHGPRALEEAQPIPRGTWNLIDVTKPVPREDDEGKARLHGPRTMSGAHRAIRKDWNMMSVTNPVRRANGGRLQLCGPQPITNRIPKPNPIPRPDPAQFNRPANSVAQKAKQRTDPNKILLLPVSYKPILTGRYPLHRSLPPIPDETYPTEDADCRPPPVPPHIVLPQRRAITMHPHNDIDSPIKRYTSVPDAPADTYLGRETLHSGWQPARCETAFRSVLEYQP